MFMESANFIAIFKSKTSIFGTEKRYITFGFKYIYTTLTNFSTKYPK